MFGIILVALRVLVLIFSVNFDEKCFYDISAILPRLEPEPSYFAASEVISLILIFYDSVWDIVGILIDLEFPPVNLSSQMFGISGQESAS